MKKLFVSVLSSSVLLAGLAAPAFASTYNMNGNSGTVNITDNSTTKITKNVTNNVTNITFNDLGNFGWAKQAIQAMAKQKIINGMGNRQFAPGKELTRAQFAALASRMFHLQAPSDSTQDFADVPPTLENGKPNYAFKPVEAAKAFFDATTDLSTGGLDFNPNQKMNRQDVAVTLVKIMVKAGLIQMDSSDQVQQVLQNYTDAESISPNLQPYVATAISNGLMKGISDTQFAPERNLRRAEAAVLLYRIEGKLTVVPGDTTTPTTTDTTNATDSSGTTTGTQSDSTSTTTTDVTTPTTTTNNTQTSTTDTTPTTTTTTSTATGQ